MSVLLENMLLTPHLLQMQTEAHRRGVSVAMGQCFKVGLAGAPGRGSTRLKREHGSAGNWSPIQSVPLAQSPVLQRIPYKGLSLPWQLGFAH